jgi:RNA polymerase sigma factor (TIGR02999 family)
MSMAASNTVTELLARWDEGPIVHAMVMPIIYREVRLIAAKLFASERENYSLQPTELVTEGYLRIYEGGPWHGRAHFFGSITRAMRRVLVDCARRRNSQKRGGHLRRVEIDGLEVELADRLAEACCKHPHILAIERAIEQLESDNPLWASILELRYFTGLSVEETAVAIGISKSKVRTEWTELGCWLRSYVK